MLVIWYATVLIKTSRLCDKLIWKLTMNLSANSSGRGQGTGSIEKYPACRYMQIEGNRGSFVFKIQIRKVVWPHCYIPDAHTCKGLKPWWASLILIPGWMCNYTHYKVRYKITYTFPNFNGAAEDWEWIKIFISHFSVHVITSPCWY